MTGTAMTRKERMRKALFYETIDCVPPRINYTAAVGQSMAAFFDVSLEHPPHYLGNHMTRVDISHHEKLSADESARFDWWGVGFDTREEGYFTAISPLEEAQDLDSYQWPDPHAPGLLKDATETIATIGDKYFVVPNLGFAVFERAWALRGFEQFFVDMATDPSYAGLLLDRITEIQLALIHRYLDLGVDGAYFGDDYGAQKKLLFSPRMWLALIKPRLARLFLPFTERGLPVIMHSDGQIQKILPDLLEIGLTTLNPVQPEVMDHDWLQEQYGGRLSFYGGVSTKPVLPYGTTGEVKTAVSSVMHKLAPQGTGLVIAPSHRMMSDIPLKNMAAMLAVFQQLTD